ncbi:hypothetical protein KP509_1Z064600 [Ceratopteris richardii]|nr:hypothetical protein KP509_1Z064600 [Ceratopteris richardii]
MVFHLAFEDHVRQHLLQPQMMSGSASDQLSQMNATSPQQAAMYLYCLGRLTPPILVGLPSPRDTRSMAQESNGEILNTSCLSKLE